MEQLDWDHIRRIAIAKGNTPADWPSHVRPISIEGLGLLGIDAQHRLYWDGKAVEVRRALTFWQSAGAVAVVLAAIVGALASAVQAYVALFG